MEKKKNFFEEHGIYFHKSLTFKLITISVLILLLLIPKVMIMSLINERKYTMEGALSEVMSRWSNEQSVRGPVLTIPYATLVNGKEKTEKARFLPKRMNIDGQIQSKKLYRSIYDIVVYESEIVITGNFVKPDFSDWNVDDTNIMWDHAEVTFAISDLRGIQDIVKLDWNGTEYEFSPGMNNYSIGNNGINVRVPVDPQWDQISYKCTLQLKGSKGLMFAPLGEETTVHLESDWSSPSFNGSFIPDNRTVSKDGFSCDWKVLYFNRNFPQKWLNNEQKVISSDFGVELLLKADHYKKNTRTAKYAILVIILTFITFFLSEIINKTRIHSFQYIMIGLAISLFYLLLLSLSEHVGFNKAYIIASAGIILMVVLYSRTFFKKIKISLLLGTMLVLIYGFIFILLQLESLALLMGSLGLFLILALTMYATRNINWYQNRD